MPQGRQAHAPEASRARRRRRGLAPHRAEWLRSKRRRRPARASRSRHMPATPLPASGDIPAGTPKTCDASGMVEIHRLFRRGLRRGPRPRQAGPRGRHRPRGGRRDAARDDVDRPARAPRGRGRALWDALEERAPSCTAHVERMKAQHAELLGAPDGAGSRRFPHGAPRRRRRMPRPCWRRWTA